MPANWRLQSCCTCDPGLVQMGKAETDLHFERSNYIWWDLQQASPVTYQEWFSRYSKTGTVGDPTKASAEERTQSRGGCSWTAGGLSR